MTITITPIASQNPFVDSNLTQSNPGSSAVDSGGIVDQTTNNTSNILLYSGTQNKAQSIQIAAVPLANWFDYFSAGCELRLLYTDVNNYVYTMFEHNGTNDNWVHIIKKVAGTDTNLVTYTGLADSYFSDSGDTIKFDVGWSGADATFTATKGGANIGTPNTQTSFPLTSGVSGYVLNRSGSPRSIRFSSLVITGDMAAVAVIGGRAARQRPVGRGPCMRRSRGAFKRSQGSQATRQVLLQLFSSPGVPLASTSVTFYTAYDDASAAIDGPMVRTTDSSGYVLLVGLNIAAAAGNIRYQVTGDPTKHRVSAVNFVN